MRAPKRELLPGFLSWALGLALLGLAPKAHAVRPFVTDDARIVDFGQLELENWIELARYDRRFFLTVNAMAGVTLTDWLEIISGSGVGIDREGVTVANPVLQPKLLLWPAAEAGWPGLALAFGLTLPAGRGELYDDATGFYAIAPITVRLLRDWLLVHVNLGAVSAFEPSGAARTRPYWGIGFDLGVATPELRLIGEAYAGDPLDAFGPEHAFQFGGRWLASDYVNVDVTFGAQPPVDAPVGMPYEMWAQVGLRLLFDAFTHRGLPGDPLGARGMMANPFE